MIFIGNQRFVLQFFKQKNGAAPFEKWLDSLDGAVRARVTARVYRFEHGYFGDYKSIGDGVYEARFFIGPGYRVYFAVHNSQILLLLLGGDKSSQSRDVALAKQYYRNFLEVQIANKKW